MICGSENGTNGCHLTGFSEDVAFDLYFVATFLPPTLPSYRRASCIGYASKIDLKWQAIQLAIHSIVDEEIDYKWNYGKFQVSICFPSRVTILQTIKISISKYLTNNLISISQIFIALGFCVRWL